MRKNSVSYFNELQRARSNSSMRLNQVNIESAKNLRKISELLPESKIPTDVRRGLSTDNR